MPEIENTVKAENPVTEPVLPKESRFVVLSAEELNELIRKTAFETAVQTVTKMEIVNEEKAKAYKDKRLRNTKLLLRNYRMLKKGCEEAVWNREVAKRASEEMDILMLMKADDRVVVDSIKQSSEKTAVILAHIDRMIEVYKSFCYKFGEREKRRYKALQVVYLNVAKLKMSEAAAKLGITLPTLYADLAIAEESLASLIFGFDGLKFTT